MAATAATAPAPEAGIPIDAAQPDRQSVARALSWTSLESLGLSGLSFVTLIVLARYLTPPQFGIASMALGIVQVLNIPVEMLFHDALVQRPAATALHFDTAFSFSVLLGLLLCGLCWWLAVPVARLLRVPDLAPVLSWMSLSLVAMGFGSAIIARHRRHLHFRPLALRSLIGRLSGAVAGITIAVSGGGVWSLVVQQVAMVWLATLALWIGSTERPRFRCGGRELIDLLRFGVPAMSVTGLYFVVQRWFMLLTGNILGAAAAGYMGLGFRAIDSIRDVAAGAVSQLALPVYSRLQTRIDDLRNAFVMATRLTCALMFPLFGSLAVCAKDAVALVFGLRWLPAAPLVSLMACLALYYFARMFAAPLMSARRRPHYPIAGQLAQFAFITVTLLCWHGVSLWTVATIWALRLAVSAPIDIWLLRRAAGAAPATQLAAFAVPLAAAASMVLTEYAVRSLLGSVAIPWLRLAAIVPAGLTVYVATLYSMDAALCRKLLHYAQLALTPTRGRAPVHA